MAYSGTGATGGGYCPATHPVKLPQIMYEIMWNVSVFDRSEQSDTPLVYSMGIGGAAAHGDYVFGWEGNTLQEAMDNHCNLNNDCPAAGIHKQQPSVYSACTKPQEAPEQVDGWLPSLPTGGMIGAG